MKRLILIVIVLALVGVGAGAYYMNRPAKEPDVRTAQVTRGDIVDAVAATGTLEAVTTVQVGTQVGGTIQELYADFNSIVKKGQVIARLDPTLLQTNIEQQRANVMRSEADLDRLKVALADAQQKLDRAKALSKRASCRRRTSTPQWSTCSPRRRRSSPPRRGWSRRSRSSIRPK